MRAILLLVGLVVVFLVGGYVDHVYGWPFSLLDASPSSVPMPAGVAPPLYSRAQGAEDAPRNDVPQGGRVDMQRCIATMVDRREPEQEARQVCQKIISGIGG